MFDTLQHDATKNDLKHLLTEQYVHPSLMSDSYIQLFLPDD